jgi:hypothetical protein
MDDTAKLLLVGGAVLIGYKVMQAQRDIANLANAASPILRDAQGIAANVRGFTGSLQGISNAAVAVTNGLRTAFGLSSSSSSAPGMPLYTQGSFSTTAMTGLSNGSFQLQTPDLGSSYFNPNNFMNVGGGSAFGGGAGSQAANPFQLSTPELGSSYFGDSNFMTVS